MDVGLTDIEMANGLEYEDMAFDEDRVYEMEYEVRVRYQHLLTLYGCCAVNICSFYSVYECVSVYMCEYITSLVSDVDAESTVSLLT